MQLTLLSLLSPLALAQFAPPSIPNCGLPADPACLVKNAQYTVVGTIMSTNENDPGNGPSRYNATMNIRCIWASFSSPVSAGNGLVGKTITVANWGKPKAACPRGSGAEAKVNDTQIYFLYVGQRPGAGVPPESIIYSVQSICVGGVDLGNVTTVAQVLQDNPGNAISAQNRGTDPFCTLPTINNAGPTAKPTGANFDPSTSSSINSNNAMGVFALFLFSCIALSF